MLTSSDSSRAVRARTPRASHGRRVDELVDERVDEPVCELVVAWVVVVVVMPFRRTGPGALDMGTGAGCRLGGLRWRHGSTHRRARRPGGPDRRGEGPGSLALTALPRRPAELQGTGDPVCRW